MVRCVRPTNWPRHALLPPAPTTLSIVHFAVPHATQRQAALDVAKTPARMLVLHPEPDIAAGPIAHPFRKILARNSFALTLAHLRLGRRCPEDAALIAQWRGLAHLRLGRRCRRRCRFPRTTPFPVTPTLLAPPLTPLPAGPIIPARLHPMPTRCRLTALRPAITSQRMTRNEPTFTTIQQTATGITPRFRPLPDSARMMK